MVGERFVSVTGGWEPSARREPVWVMTVAGEVDLAGIPEVTRGAEAVPRTARKLVVDLAGVTFIDAAGLRGLRKILIDGATRGLSVQFRSPSPIISRVASLAGLDLVLPLGEQADC